MPYDPELDKELDKREITVDGQIWDISLKAYNGGEPKIAIAMRDGRFAVKRYPPKVFLAAAEAVKTMAVPSAAVPTAPEN